MEFTIWGYTAPWRVQVSRLPGGRLGFRLPAAGWSTGALRGRFTFNEEGEFDFRAGQGANHGLMTVTRLDGSQAVIRFEGRASSCRVMGAWQVVAATGLLAGLTGGGYYSGNAGLLFGVRFR